jgi:hypothetical protein
MKVPAHIVKFAEASMEQAALITFAKKLNLKGTKFLDASRDTGTLLRYRLYLELATQFASPNS